MISSRIYYPATRLAPDSRSRRLPFLPASGHYANEDAPDQRGNLRISAKSGRTSRAQGGKSRREEKKRDRERERGASCSLVRGYLYSDRFPIIGGTNEREFAAAPTERRNRRGSCVIGIHLWARMSCRSLLSLVSPSLFRAYPSLSTTGSLTSFPLRHAVFPPSHLADSHGNHIPHEYFTQKHA